MRRRPTTTWVLAGLLLCSTLSVGCNPLALLGPNFSLNLVIPLGLSGSPGILNPFGIVQALVNTALGTTTDTTDGTDDGAGLTTTFPTAPGSVGAIVGPTDP